MHDMTIATLRSAYLDGSLTVDNVIGQALRTIRQADDRNVWISVVSAEFLEPYLKRLKNSRPEELPLYGIPFAVKDNIDVVDMPTTAACPAYAFTPQNSAHVVQRLIDAGAIPLGKTNMDQFAAGLVGTRSPYGPCGNAFDQRFVSGGSSSGSAVAVALGHVSFALGTDTAGSGRVPAAFNNILGLKPSRGVLSTSGVVPACRTLDTVSLFTLTATDALAVFDSAAGFDPADPYSRRPPSGGLRSAPIDLTRFRVGIPAREQLRFFGDREYESAFSSAVERIRSLGGTVVSVDFAPFLEAASLLYEGPWVAERFAAIRPFIESNPNALLAVTRTIIDRGRIPTAVDLFEAQYRLQSLKRSTDKAWNQVDLIMTPTTGTIPTIAEVQVDPFEINTALGYYTNFMNLLDYCAVTVPADFRSDGLPFGVTLFAPTFRDRELLAICHEFQVSTDLPLGTSERMLPKATSFPSFPSHTVPVAVCGAHMTGFPLNHELTTRGARFVQRTHTAPEYQLYALSEERVERPGLIRVAEGGVSIEVEVWELPSENVGEFLMQIESPLGIGFVRLWNGDSVPGFLCEGAAIPRSHNISDFGSWRRYQESRTRG